MTETEKEAESGAALSVATHSENIVRTSSLLIIRFFHVLYSDHVLNGHQLCLKQSGGQNQADAKRGSMVFC